MAGYYESRSEFDGFDNSDSVQKYDDRKEKRFQADIWIFLSIIFAGIFAANGYKHIRELWLVRNGICIEAEYFADQMRATYFDEDRNYYSFDVSGTRPVTEGNVVRLYYTDEIRSARPQTTNAFWIGCYIIFGSLSALCIWRVVSVYRKKKTNGGIL